MGRPRTFDWDEARRLRGEGLSLKAIGDRFGVSHIAVLHATNDAYRERSRAQTRRCMEEKKTPCPDCGKLVWANRHLQKSFTGLCFDCLIERRRAVAVNRHGTESGYDYGCRCEDCRSAATAGRRRRRAAAKENLVAV